MKPRGAGFFDQDEEISAAGDPEVVPLQHLAEPSGRRGEAPAGVALPGAVGQRRLADGERRIRNRPGAEELRKAVDDGKAESQAEVKQGDGRGVRVRL